MTDLRSLLPGPQESLRCAEHARQLAANPGGTAIVADRIMLVGIPLPWPKPVFDHLDLRPIKTLVDAAPITTKLLAAVPPKGLDAGLSQVTVFDRLGAATRRRDYVVEVGADLNELCAALAREADLPSEGEVSFLPKGPFALLVCTQGSHDVCCGADGERLAMAVSEQLPEVDVFRVSHLGGHRFAPTALTMPDGRMWANLDVEGVAAALGLTGAPSTVWPAERCRGWWGASQGPAQVAETAIRAMTGAEFDRTDRTAEAVDENTVLIDSALGRWRVGVRRVREVPVIACRSEGGLPAKTAIEYEVTSIE